MSTEILAQETDDSAPPARALPFSRDKQDAVVGHLLVNDKFYTQLAPRVQDTWFLNPYNGKIFNAKKKFTDRFRRPPTLAELKECNDFLLEEEVVRRGIMTQMDLAIFQTKNFQLDALIPELTDWLQSTIMQRLVVQGAKLYNGAIKSRRDPRETAYPFVAQMVQELQAASFYEDHEIDFSNYKAQFEKREAEYANALTWGVKLFDQKLTPAAQKGCLLKGDTTVVEAPTNVGKTSTLLTVARHNIKLGKSVLLLTHEGTDGDLVQKLWCGLMGVNAAELLTMYKTPEGCAQLDRWLQFFKKFLCFVHLPQAGMTVERVLAIIRRKQDERIANTGAGFDLLIDDYPACLTTVLASKGNMKPMEIIDYVYAQFVQTGLEHNWHSLLSIQTNREGSKVNRGKEDRLLTPEDMSETFKPAMRATNIITVNRPPQAMVEGWVTYLQCKSRSSETGWAITCESDFGRAVTHGDNCPSPTATPEMVAQGRGNLKSVCYRSYSTLANHMKNYLSQFNGQAIPQHLWEM